MPADEPSWWYGDGEDPKTRALEPLSRIWGWAAVRRFRGQSPYRASLPVICVGNFTAGGTGKTPLSLHIAGELAALGERPAFLTRGYGGRTRGPRRVDPALDEASEVGDEPLLLARHASVVVARDRAAGARLIEADAGIAPASAIVMDDGLQNPGLAKDLTIAVVDGRRGLGNRRVMPGGPLRAPLDFQLGLADAIVVNRLGPDAPDGSAIAEELRRSFAGPVLEAQVEPAADVAELKGANVVAFAGIADPARFFDLLERQGARILERLSFPDHHPFSEADARRVLELARTTGAQIVTTEKDQVRLARGGSRGALRELARTLPIRLRLEERDRVRLASLIASALANRRRAEAAGQAPQRSS